MKLLRKANMNTKTISRGNSFINYVFQNIVLVTLKLSIFDFYDTFFPIQTVLVAFPKFRKNAFLMSKGQDDIERNNCTSAVKHLFYQYGLIFMCASNGLTYFHK